jgi:hypothetical protein
LRGRLKGPTPQDSSIHPSEDETEENSARQLDDPVVDPRLPEAFRIEVFSLRGRREWCVGRSHDLPLYEHETRAGRIEHDESDDGSSSVTSLPFHLGPDQGFFLIGETSQMKAAVLFLTGAVIRRGARLETVPA